MEKLADYLSRTKTSQRKFAEQVGIDNSVVSRFASGTATPSLKTALLIEQLTGGCVGPSSWDQGQEAGQ